MRELNKDAFPELVAEYAKEGKTVIGFTHWEDDQNYGLPKLEVKWVWTEICNGDTNHA